MLDDLSSAVDVETELQLWANLAEAGLTVLAVSHRAVAFERADQVLRLDHGAPDRLLSAVPPRAAQTSRTPSTAVAESLASPAPWPPSIPSPSWRASASG